MFRPFWGASLVELVSQSAIFYVSRANNRALNNLATRLPLLCRRSTRSDAFQFSSAIIKSLEKRFHSIIIILFRITLHSVSYSSPFFSLLSFLPFFFLLFFHFQRRRNDSENRRDLKARSLMLVIVDNISEAALYPSSNYIGAAAPAELGE